MNEILLYIFKLETGRGGSILWRAQKCEEKKLVK